ncbi:MAG: cbs domain containing protein [Cyclobacteriaceae bacterium]
MIAQELINQMVPALKFTDTAEKAIIWMEELKTNQLPVVESLSFKGFVYEDSLLELSDLDRLIGEVQMQNQNCFVFKGQHFFDILKMGHEHASNMVAIIDNNEEYLGVTSLQDTVKAFSATASIQSHGSIMIISTRYIDYSLNEISRIVESNNAKIMSCFISPDPQDSSKVLLTLKVNSTDTSSISVTLERNNYKIVARFHQEDRDLQSRDRIDNLLKFIDI